MLEANTRLEETPEFEEEIKAVFARWDAKDPALMQLWGSDQTMVSGWFQSHFMMKWEFILIKFISKAGKMPTGKWWLIL